MASGLTGDWGKLSKLIGGKANATKLIQSSKLFAIRRTAAYFERQLKLNIKSGGSLASMPFKPLSQRTIDEKGSSAPLIDTGDMRNSIHPNVLDYNTAFVGIQRGEVSDENGENLIDIALLHENGGINEEGNYVPSRPFIAPIYDKFKKEAFEKYAENLEKAFMKRMS